MIEASDATDDGGTVAKLPNGWLVHQLNSAETSFMYSELFESNQLPVWLSDLPSQATLVDVGANVGLFALLVSALCPRLSVVAFEPIPIACAVLRRNFDQHGILGKVLQLAIGAEEASDVPFGWYPKTTMLSGFNADPERALATMQRVAQRLGSVDDTGAKQNGPSFAERLELRELRCEVQPLRHLFRELGLTKVDILKIDVEGWELQVLEGLDEQAWKAVRRVLVEVDSLHLATIQKLLRSRGFGIETYESPLLEGTGFQSVFAKREYT